ncbi:hypothetical protein [Chitinophaga sp.]|uniref:hypothetical protein n=1 Tax=Chitinophaga sp. TaxID=1869181 RepID=UPI0031DC57E1
MKTKPLFLVTLLIVPALRTLAQNDFPSSGNVRINTTQSYNTLDVYGSVGLGSGLDNMTVRPPVSSGTLTGELRGIGAHNHSDDGFLRLSAGGGTNTYTKSFIDLSGYTDNLNERHQNIIMATSGKKECGSITLAM